MQRVLPLHGLQLGDQDRGTNEAIFERGCNAVQIVPVVHDELVADIFFERGRQDAIVRSFSRPVEGLIRQIAEPGGKAKSQQREQPKNLIGIADRIGIVLFNLLGILIEQS